MVKNTPKASWLMITSKRKMQRAQEVEMDYSGTNTETLVFDNDIEKLENNFNVTMDFINQLADGHSLVFTHMLMFGIT
jgi:predicted ferric reductase